jgi:hypothetical protein
VPEGSTATTAGTCNGAQSIVIQTLGLFVGWAPHTLHQFPKFSDEFGVLLFLTDATWPPLLLLDRC